MTIITELKPIPEELKKNPKRQRTGRDNRAHGKAFEELLDSSFAYYAKTGFAQVDKTPEPMKVLRSLEHGRFIACFDKQAQPDYKGTIKGGRTVMFEAKFTTAERLQSSAVKEEQERYLTKATELGARCFVIAGFQGGSAYKIPWNVWTDMKQIFGRKYVTEADLEKYKIPTSWNGRLQIFD